MISTTISYYVCTVTCYHICLISQYFIQNVSCMYTDFIINWNSSATGDKNTYIHVGTYTRTHMYPWQIHTFNNNKWRRQPDVTHPMMKGTHRHRIFSHQRNRARSRSLSNTQGHHYCVHSRATARDCARARAIAFVWEVYQPPVVRDHAQLARDLGSVCTMYSVSHNGMSHFVML